MAIDYQKEGKIAIFTINRPEALNSMNVQAARELHEAMVDFRDDPELWVGIITGAGDRAFCAGADLSEFLTAPSPTAARQIRWERDVWGLFLSLPQPLIAALHGYVFGSGIEIALCCDIRIACEDALFGLPEVGLGIIPAAGATQTLPRAIGQARALDMMLAGSRISAKEALDIRLVNEVVSKGELLPIVNSMAEQIAHFDSAVVRNIKQAVVRGLNLSLVEGLELEKRLASLVFQSKARDSS